MKIHGSMTFLLNTTAHMTNVQMKQKNIVY